MKFWILLFVNSLVYSQKIIGGQVAIKNYFDVFFCLTNIGLDLQNVFLDDFYLGVEKKLDFISYYLSNVSLKLGGRLNKKTWLLMFNYRFKTPYISINFSFGYCNKLNVHWYISNNHENYKIYFGSEFFSTSRLYSVLEDLTESVVFEEVSSVQNNSRPKEDVLLTKSLIITSRKEFCDYDEVNLDKCPQEEYLKNREKINIDKLIAGEAATIQINNFMLLNLLYSLSVSQQSENSSRQFEKDLQLFLTANYSKIGQANKREINQQSFEEYYSLYMFLNNNPEIKRRFIDIRLAKERTVLIAGQLFAMYGVFLHQALYYGMSTPLENFVKFVTKQLTRKMPQGSLCSIDFSKSLHFDSEIFDFLVFVDLENSPLKDSSDLNNKELDNYLIRLYSLFIYQYWLKTQSLPVYHVIDKFNKKLCESLKKINNEQNNLNYWLDCMYPESNISKFIQQQLSLEDEHILTYQDLFFMVNQIKEQNEQMWIEFCSKHYQNIVHSNPFVIYNITSESPNDYDFSKFVSLMSNKKISNQKATAYKVVHSRYLHQAQTIYNIFESFGVFRRFGFIASPANFLIISEDEELKVYEERFKIQECEKFIFIKHNNELYVWKDNKKQKINIKNNQVLCVCSDYILIDFDGHNTIHEVSFKKEGEKYSIVCSKQKGDLSFYCNNLLSALKGVCYCDINLCEVDNSKIQKNAQIFKKTMKIHCKIDETKIEELLDKYVGSFKNLLERERQAKSLYVQPKKTVLFESNIERLQQELAPFLHDDNSAIQRHMVQKIKFPNSIREKHQNCEQFLKITLLNSIEPYEPLKVEKNDQKEKAHRFVFENYSLWNKSSELQNAYNTVERASNCEDSRDLECFDHKQIMRTKGKKLSDIIRSKDSSIPSFVGQISRLEPLYYVSKKYNDLLFSSLVFIRGVFFEKDGNYGTTSSGKSLKNRFLINLLDKLKFGKFFEEFANQYCVLKISETAGFTSGLENLNTKLKEGKCQLTNSLANPEKYIRYLSKLEKQFEQDNLDNIVLDFNDPNLLELLITISDIEKFYNSFNLFDSCV